VSPIPAVNRCGEEEAVKELPWEFVAYCSGLIVDPRGLRECRVRGTQMRLNQTPRLGNQDSISFSGGDMHTIASYGLAYHEET
jgi:hypothetical protein